MSTAKRAIQTLCRWVEIDWPAAAPALAWTSETSREKWHRVRLVAKTTPDYLCRRLAAPHPATFHSGSNTNHGTHLLHTAAIPRIRPDRPNKRISSCSGARLKGHARQSANSSQGMSSTSQKTNAYFAAAGVCRVGWVCPHFQWATPKYNAIEQTMTFVSARRNWEVSATRL